ncbi:MAG: hypothetical protein ACI4PM_02965 [Butyricicoccus sp.]
MPVLLITSFLVVPAVWKLMVQYRDYERLSPPCMIVTYLFVLSLGCIVAMSVVG